MRFYSPSQLLQDAKRHKIAIRPIDVMHSDWEAKLLGVYGIWQTDGKVHHLIAKRLVDMSHLLGNFIAASRDFC